MTSFQKALVESLFFIPQCIVYFYYFFNMLHSKFAKWKTSAVFFGTLTIYWAFPELSRANVAFRMVAIAFTIVWYYLCFTDKLLRKIMTLIIMLVITYITDQIVCHLISFLVFDFDATFYPSLERYIAILLASIVMFPQFMLAITIWNRNMYLINVRYIFILIFLPLAQLALLFLTFIVKRQDITIGDTILLLVSQLIMIFLESLQFSNIQKTILYEKQQKELLSYQQKVQMDYQYYELTKTHIQKISQIRHDMYNQLQTMQGLITAKKLDSASALSQKISEEMQDMQQLSFCTNPIINVVACIKQQKADVAGISIQFRLNNTDCFNLAEHELCSLFSNLLDNAIEACMQCPNSANKNILLCTGIQGDYSVIHQENTTINSDFTQKTDVLITSKKYNLDEHGFGMKIIRQIVADAGGVFHYYCKANLFSITILLPHNSLLEEKDDESSCTYLNM